MVKVNLNDGCGPSIYSYADSMKQALEKYSKKTGRSQGITMNNTTGRDNAMYYISDNNNL